MFRVQDRMCDTCIYRADSPLDVKQLEAQVADAYGGFKGHRICHHSKDACCRGFWNRHKDKFQLGQVAQRLNMVEFVHDDTFQTITDDEEVAMRTWVYIICEVVDGNPSFRHAFIEAEDEEAAYAVAHRRVPQPTGNGINDYVVEIGSAPDGEGVIGE